MQKKTGVKKKMDVLTISESEYTYIWQELQSQQMVFHPTLAPAGRFNSQEFFRSLETKPFSLFIDRNILSSLLQFCKDGHIQSAEAKRIGVLMTWSRLCGIDISAGLAVRERASQRHSQSSALLELQKFFDVFDQYPLQMWLQVATGRLNIIPQITFSGKAAYGISVDYSDPGDHYEMAVASLLHLVWLYRNNDATPLEKIRNFYLWLYDNLLISEYLLVYAAMLFTNQSKIKAPKRANSNNLKAIISGCENQAWDISYLTNWSTLYSEPERYDKEFLFATNDNLLKLIFINTNRPYRLNGVLFSVLPKREYDQIIELFQEKQSVRMKPDFGANPSAYFRALIETETDRLLSLPGIEDTSS